jgi:hypothetical protein
LISHIMRRLCSVKHGIKGNVRGRIVVSRRRGVKRKQLLNDLKETEGHWNFKEEALARTLWGTRFGTGYGPVVR